MARHAARRRWFGHGRTRALLTLGTVFALGATGTAAYWTDTATVTGGTITSGTMDLQVAASSAGPWQAVGTDTDWTAATHIAVNDLTPSESYAYNLTVRNVGAADFRLTATVAQGATPAWGFTPGTITVELFRGGTPSAVSTYPIQQQCSGGVPLGSAVPVTAGNTVVITTPERLDGAASLTLCVKVTMIAGADNTNQDKSGQLRFDFTANQVTS